MGVFLAWSFRGVLILAACAAAVLAPQASHAAVPNYTLVGQYTLPQGAWDILPDGRLLGVQPNGVVVRQTSVNASVYQAVGSIDASAVFGSSIFGASFLSLSPDGTKAAIGSNGAGNLTWIFPTASLQAGGQASGTNYFAPNTEASWDGESRLYVSGYNAGGVVTRIDLAAQNSATVISGIPSPAGIAIRGGRLYTGDGFDTTNASVPTGYVRALALASLPANGGQPVAFSSGALVADALSAASLGFDPFGNLLVGGGDFFAGSNDYGYGAVVDGDAVAAALAGGPVAPDSAELRLSPSGVPHSYAIRFNAVTNELLVSDGATAFRYAVPAPAGAAAPMLAGVLALARRRR